MKQHKYINNPLIISLLLVPLVEPYGIIEMSMYVGGIWKYINTLFGVLKWLSVFCIVLLTLTNTRKKDDSGLLVVFLVIYQLWIIVIAQLRGNLYITNIKFAVASISIVLLFKNYICYYDAQRFVLIVERVFFIWILINLASLILYPEGMYITDRGWKANWFLGYRNIHIYYYIPYLALLGVRQYLINRKISSSYYVGIVMIIISSLLAGSYTTSLAMGIFGAFFVWGKYKKKAFEKINIMTTYFSSVIISVLIIFFNYQSSFINNIIMLLSGIIGRSISLDTMSSRTVIWERAIEEINKHPIAGNGNFSFTDIFTTWTVTQAHNTFLDIVITGGIVLLLVFTLILIQIHKSIKECLSVELKNIVTLSFVAYCILFITEARRDTVLLYMYLILVFYFPTIIKRCSIKIDCQ